MNAADRCANCDHERSLHHWDRGNPHYCHVLGATSRSDCRCRRFVEDVPEDAILAEIQRLRRVTQHALELRHSIYYGEPLNTKTEKWANELGTVLAALEVGLQHLQAARQGSPLEPTPWRG